MREVDSVDARLADRLGGLRAERGWSLDELSERAGVSRSTLSRLERGELSPAAALLNRLCAAYGRTMSGLLAEVEDAPPRVVRAAEQAVWADPEAGFTRRSVSPPHGGLRAELVEGVLEAGAVVGYDRPPVPGLEQHVWLLEGELEITLDGVATVLHPGDCLRFRLEGTSAFRATGAVAARYVIAVVTP
jgi:transcriptional regulator with XRE-family HTH domain